MKKYQASTPDALVIGAALKAYEHSIEYDEFKPILENYGLTQIDPDKWYPQQLTLDIQQAIKKSAGGGMKLVSIGVKIIDSAHFPPMHSLEDAMNAFASSYPMNFKQQSPHDIIEAEMIAPGHIVVRNRSPHSDEMIYGYVDALVRRFKPKGSDPVVQFEDIHKIDSDGDTLIHVKY